MQWTVSSPLHNAAEEFDYPLRAAAGSQIWIMPQGVKFGSGESSQNLSLKKSHLGALQYPIPMRTNQENSLSW